jgi:hypothetical protein
MGQRRKRLSLSGPHAGGDAHRLGDGDRCRSFLAEGCPQPSNRARLTGDTVQITLDLGAAYSFDCAALVSSSLTSAATARLRASAGRRRGDRHAALRFGRAGECDRQKWNGLVVGVVTTPVTIRYLRWDLVDSRAAYIDVGLAPCGLLFRPTHNFAYGAQEGRFDPSPRDKNPDTGMRVRLRAAAGALPRHSSCRR